MVIECISKAKPNHAAVYLVKRAAGGDEMIIGMLEKYNNTRSETHPWKAWLGFGATRQYLGAFYAEEGGREAALSAIERASV
jgi:hypothetical protein